MPRTAQGWDNAKKVYGRKRHIAVDATGLLLAVSSAPPPSRVATRPGRPQWNHHRSCRRVWLICADLICAGAGYTGKLAAWAATMKLTVQIVAKPDPHVFQVLPRRWVAERTFAWISKHRRTVRNYESLPASHVATIT